MKSFNYKFDSSDIKTLCFLLSVTSDLLPYCSVEDFDKSAISNQCKYARSVSEKLMNFNSSISAFELQATYNALIFSEKILNNEIPVSKEIFDSISEYSFSINKLLIVFDNYFC